MIFLTIYGHARNLNYVIFYLCHVIKSINNTIKSNKRFPSFPDPQSFRINSDQLIIYLKFQMGVTLQK